MIKEKLLRVKDNINTKLSDSTPKYNSACNYFYKTHILGLHDGEKCLLCGFKFKISVHKNGQNSKYQSCTTHLNRKHCANVNKLRIDTWLENQKEGIKNSTYVRTEEHCLHLSEGHYDCKGENNPMYGKSLYSVWLTKYGKEKADKRAKQYIEKLVTEENRKMWSDTWTKTNIRLNTTKFECPNCKRIITGDANFKRFHDDNCKILKVGTMHVKTVDQLPKEAIIIKATDAGITYKVNGDKNADVLIERCKQLKRETKDERRKNRVKKIKPIIVKEKKIHKSRGKIRPIIYKSILVFNENNKLVEEFESMKSAQIKYPYYIKWLMKNPDVSIRKYKVLFKYKYNTPDHRAPKKK